MASTRRWGSAALITTLLLTAPACTSSTAEFCGALTEHYQLETLISAIETEDTKSTAASLKALQDVQDLAPAEIYDDFRNIVSVLSDLVRYVTDSAGPDGQTNPVNIDKLDSELSEIAVPAQNVATFAEEECGLRLS